MELKGRLKQIAKELESCRSVCDIGTDHAYIPIHLIEKRRCIRCIASDMRSGPIRVAQKNIKEHGLVDSIELRICDGLECIEIDECNAAIIAGMGGISIVDILKKDIEKAKSFEQLILQPMFSQEILRKWLVENGFDIYKESIAREDERYYTVLSVKWTGKMDKWPEHLYYIGKYIYDNKPYLYREYIKNRIRIMKDVIVGLEKSKSNDQTDLIYNRKICGELENIIEQETKK